MKKIYSLFLVFILLSFSSVFAVVSHPASQIEPGSFQAGNYSFPNSNVGIGTPAPGYLLHVKAASNPVVKIDGVDENTNALLLLANDARQWAIEVRGDDGSDALRFRDSTGVATRMIIDTYGRVGIGTTSPVGKLSVADGTNGHIYFAFDGVQNYIESSNNAATDVRNLEITGNADRAMAVLTLKANTTYATGNVGIGTASPQTALQVEGGVRVGRYATGGRPTCNANLQGTFIFDTTLLKPYVCDGTNWKPLDSDFDSDGITDAIDTDDTNPNDATAAVGDVLTGKTFYSGSTARTGTMPNIGTQTITPSTTTQYISAGYHNGAGYCAGDGDLVSGNIRSGVNIFGVSGNSNVVDTSAGTISSSALIRSGYVAYSDGSQYTGTLANCVANGNACYANGGAWEASECADSTTGTRTNCYVDTTAKYVDSNACSAASNTGYCYMNTATLSAKDSDLTSANIASGVNIFGVTGSLQGESVFGSQWQLNPGWNFLGIPCTLPDYNFSAIFGEYNTTEYLSMILWYQGPYSGYRVYLPEYPVESPVNSLKGMAYGNGYAIAANKIFTIQLNCTGQPSRSHEMLRGWNSFSPNTIIEGSYLNHTASFNIDKITEYYNYWDASNENYTEYDYNTDPTGFTNYKMFPGHDYMINCASKYCNWTMPAVS